MTQGVVYIHSAPRALAPHIEWAAGGVLGMPFVPAPGQCLTATADSPMTPTTIVLSTIPGTPDCTMTVNAGGSAGPVIVSEGFYRVGKGKGDQGIERV